MGLVGVFCFDYCGVGFLFAGFDLVVAEGDQEWRVLYSGVHQLRPFGSAALVLESSVVHHSLDD